jgi:hypothetical protein
MSHRLSILALAITGATFFSGCTGPESFRSYSHEGAEGHSPSAQEGFGESDLGAFVQPVIDSFLAEPLYFPLGGGEVDLSWSVRNATSCALLIDGQHNTVGAEGMASVNVDADTSLALRCIDDEDESDTITHQVVVQSPPVDLFDESPSALDSPDFAKVTTQSKFGANSVIELRLSLEERSQVSLSPSALPLRTAVTLWLAQDSNQDGVVDPEEIIAIAGSNAEAQISTALEPGNYSIFIESDGQAVDWVVNSYITPLGEESA